MRRHAKTTKPVRTKKHVPTELARQIGDALREARSRFDLTQEDVAERVDLATEVYGRMERGIVTPSVPTLVRLVTVLGVSANFLVGLDAELSPDDNPSAQPPGNDGLTSDARRVLRVVRRMDSGELSTFRKLSNEFVKHFAKRKSDKVEPDGR